MSIRDNKKSIFTKIGSYSSMMENINKTDTSNLFPSVNNKKDIVPFMLDILKVVAGSDAIKELSGELLTKFIASAETKMKASLKNQATQYNSGDNLPNDFKTTGSGYTFSAITVDPYGKYNNPSTDTKNLLYDTNNGHPNFDTAMYSATQNAGSMYNFGSALTVKYNNIDNSYTFYENPTLGTTVGTWVNAYINDIAIINKKEFLSNVVNGMYGTISKNQSKTVEQIHEELVINQLIQQLIDDDDSFEVSPEKMTELLKMAEDILNGVVYYDMGCGVMGATLPIADMTKLVSDLSGVTDSFIVSDTLDKAHQNTLNDPTTGTENAETIKDSFFHRLIRLITLEFGKAITTSPQIRVFTGIIDSIQNNGKSKLRTVKEDLKKFKSFIKCNIRAIMAAINEFIYNLLIKFIVMITRPVIKEIIKEKIKHYKEIIIGLSSPIPVNT